MSSGGARQATYVYGLVRSARRPSLRKPPEGLPGTGPVRVVPAGPGLWLVVADAPLAQYDKATVERSLSDLEWVSARAVGHERVVERFAGRFTLVPMKLFTLFTSDAAAAADIARQRKRVSRVLDRVAGRREWGLRLHWDEARARRAARSAAAAPAAGPAGIQFLLRKKLEQTESRRLAEGARADAERIFRELAREADEARSRPPARTDGAARLLLDAAFLVPTVRTRRFRDALVRATAGLEERGFDVTLTGPWPPYNFIADRS
ncbi:MAG TPA: GvpL/GvpF family gas vesicle protein [Vicinamibacteria bacterium]